MFNRADYFAFKRIEYSPSDLSQAGPWDYFLSAFDGTERVLIPFQQVRADHKQWLLHEEYGFLPEEWPSGAIEISSSFDPPSMREFVKENSCKLRGRKICVDSTGFIRPHLLVLLHALRDIGVRSFDVLYSDPKRYTADEHTTFTGPVAKVDQIPGYQGIHRPSASNDILIIGAGYDYEQILSACDAKRTSKKYVLTGLPSLKPHMYQESVLQIDHAREWLGSLPQQQLLYAAANNLFTAAQTLQDVVENEKQYASAVNKWEPNIYLCPVGPKPHVLGFAVYYLRELQDTSVSIIYPFAEGYQRLTTDGFMRTWQFQIEL